MEPIEEAVKCYDQMLIVEKYEKVISYLYPIAQRLGDARAKRKVANFIKHGEDEGLQKFLASWSGHAMWADANNLFTWLEKRHGIALH